MKIEIIHEHILLDNFYSSKGVCHLEDKYKKLESVSELLQYKPYSIYGSCYLALLKGKHKNHYCWVKPIKGGTYSWEMPIFKITYIIMDILQAW